MLYLDRGAVAFSLRVREVAARAGVHYLDFTLSMQTISPADTITAVGS